MLKIINGVSNVECLRKILNKKLKGDSVGIYDGKEVYSIPDSDVVTIDGNRVFIYIMDTGETYLAREF